MNIITEIAKSNISGEIYYPSVKQCVDFEVDLNNGWDKIFQDGPNISEIFVPGGPNIATKLK